MSRFESWRQDENDKARAATVQQQPTRALTACCNACHHDVRVRVEVRTQTFRVVVCGACAVALAARFREVGEPFRVLAMVSRKINPWTVSDGRYFARDVDATEQQNTINEAERRYADRVRRVIAREAEQARRVA